MILLLGLRIFHDVLHQRCGAVTTVGRKTGGPSDSELRSVATDRREEVGDALKKLSIIN